MEAQVKAADLQNRLVEMQVRAMQRAEDEHAAKRAQLDVVQGAAAEFSPEFLQQMAAFLKKSSG
jgi:hypothetical protein